MTNPKQIPASIDDLISEALVIEGQDAQVAGEVGYMARALVQATLPHKKQSEHYFKRKNGNYSLSIIADPDIGLPYGVIPRLLLAWMTTEAVRTKERNLVLGDSLSSFMRELDIVPTGGRWGSITRLKDQMRRLFSASVKAHYQEGGVGDIGKTITPVDEYQLWWSPKQPQQAALWESTIRLGEGFFNEVVNNPVPIDLRALKALKKSPMALDVYMWLTYRMFYLKKSTKISWESLQMQFGSNFADNKTGRQGFKRGFNLALSKVQIVYPEARINPDDKGVLLMPSKPHVKRLK
mgnify:CR=1 FL=1